MIKKVVVYFFRALLALCMVAVIGVLAGAIAAGVWIYPSFVSISDEMKTIVKDMDANSFRRSGNTEIYDASGKMIGQYGGEKYYYTKADKISEYIFNGYVAQEDERFYEHMGIDLQAILRAAISYVKNKGHIRQGGSTITQQVVKNNLLTQERSFRRKALELILALELEKLYSKDEILEIYTNSCYYGNGCYGIEAASEYYWGVTAKELSLSQAAILIGTSNSPNNYNPVVDYEAAMKKKDSVLSSMCEQGYITEYERKEALEDRPQVIGKSSSSFAEDYQNSYALDCAIRILMEQDGFAFRYLYNSEDEYTAYKTEYNREYNAMSEKLRAGGYTIRTSLRPEIQKTLQKAVDDNLKDFTTKAADGRYEMQGAAVCIDNNTQMVVAIVGGRGEKDSYNRGFLAQRQPGSSIKPLLDYGPALDCGVVKPSTKVNDSVIEVRGYAPKNAGGGQHGNVTVREALNRSLNTVAFKLFLTTGIDTCISYLEALQFTSLNSLDMGSSSLSIGGFTTGVRVTDMARGYSTLANNGQYSEKTCITSIEHFTDGILYTPKDEIVQVYTPETAFMLRDMMQGTFLESFGTAYKLRNESQIYAGKTGTTNDNKDAWFCGFSAYYTTAVWVGYDMPTSIPGLQGSTYPGYIWKAFMDEMHQELTPKEFDIPDQMVVENISNGQQESVHFQGGSYQSRRKGWDYINRNINYDETLVKDLNAYIKTQYPD